MGGVKGTKYLLKIRNHAPRATHHGKPKTVSLRFSSKRWGTKTNSESPDQTAQIISLSASILCVAFFLKTSLICFEYLLELPNQVASHEYVYPQHSFP